MNDGAVITALLSLVTTMGGGIIAYLVKQIAKRDATIEEMTATQEVSNEIKAKLADQVPGLVAENEALRRRLGE